MRVAPIVELTEDQSMQLNRLAHARRSERRVAERAQIVILASEGLQDKQIAAQLRTSRPTVGLWRKRFLEEGVPGLLKDRPRGGRPASNRAGIESEIIRRTTQTKPEEATHWSTRTLASELKISRSMVHRVWNAAGLKPHLIRRFKVSRDPDFESKLRDVVGLYLNPPDKALVLSVDEKSQCQALDRTQPGLPLIPGRCGTMTHDYRRNGTTSLFAAIDMLRGEVIAECMPRHRHQEFLKFLKRVDKDTPCELNLHLILDNLATHKHPKVKSWLKRHRRFHLHFIPTSSSWLNVIEIFFRNLTEKRLKRGAFKSVQSLVDAIMAYVQKHNERPSPFVWSAEADKIIEKVGRARAKLIISKEQVETHH